MVEHFYLGVVRIRCLHGYGLQPSAVETDVEGVEGGLDRKRQPNCVK